MTAKCVAQVFSGWKSHLLQRGTGKIGSSVLVMLSPECLRALPQECPGWRDVQGGGTPFYS